MPKPPSPSTRVTSNSAWRLPTGKALPPSAPRSAGRAGGWVGAGGGPLMTVGSYPPGAGAGAGAAADGAGPELTGRMMVASLSSESLAGFIVQAWRRANARVQDAECHPAPFRSRV